MEDSIITISVTTVFEADHSLCIKAGIIWEKPRWLTPKSPLKVLTTAGFYLCKMWSE